jgi:tRNA(fMet)-specific endonuclease VapC
MNVHSSQLAISAITYGELQWGAQNSGKPSANFAALEDFVSRLVLREFGPPAAVEFGAIRHALAKAGKPIGPYDLLIAAHARAEGLTLVTNNVREFKRVPGLKVENWLK